MHRNSIATLKSEGQDDYESYQDQYMGIGILRFQDGSYLDVCFCPHPCYIILFGKLVRPGKEAIQGIWAKNDKEFEQLMVKDGRKGRDM